jgi:hypothetical protein
VDREALSEGCRFDEWWRDPEGIAAVALAFGPGSLAMTVPFQESLSETH